MSNDIHNDDDFEGYLQSLLERDKQKDGKAKENYTEWSEHFELLKGQFEQVMRLFYKISQTLPDWECSGPDLEEQVSRVESVRNPRLRVGPAADVPPSPLGFSENGYYFLARLTKKFVDEGEEMEYEDNPTMLKHQIQVSFGHVYGDYGMGIGDTREITGQASGYCIPTVDEVVGSKRLTISKSKKLIESLDDCDIEFKIWYNSYVEEDCEEDNWRSLGIGYLYEHNLTDICKDIFKEITSDNAGERLETMDVFPKGDYPRRNPDDNNIHPAMRDTRWNNG
jgi:hypothetical protein